ncbi:hypothetical protein EV424DRAFT_1475545 [Suillus variegatus]|nr:hypothetical protein EV424DRAFT_1475545 [Suillus variegatus]
MKLSVGSQKLFYQNIRRARQPAKQRRCRRTNMNMAMAIHAARDISSQTPTSEQVWSSIRDHDTPKNIRAYKIGEFWDKIPHLERRGICDICGVPETMEHILLECELTTPRTIWKAAQDLWCKREATWPEIHFGTILGCNLATFRDNNRKKMIGKMLESAHLIWKLRCERVIKYEGKHEKFHSETEVYNRWVHTMNTRLKFNQLLTDLSRYGNKALKSEMVLKTWSRNNWVHKSGVLVGMAPCHPAGRNR